MYTTQGCVAFTLPPHHHVLPIAKPTPYSHPVSPTRSADSNGCILRWFAAAVGDLPLQRAIADLFRITASYNISGRDVRHVFTLFQPGLDGDRSPELVQRTNELGQRTREPDATPSRTRSTPPAHVPCLVRTLVEIAREDGPTNFFHFAHPQAGIKQTTTLSSRNVLGRGCTFTTWMRIQPAAPSSPPPPPLSQQQDDNTQEESASLIQHRASPFYSAWPPPDEKGEGTVGGAAPAPPDTRPTPDTTTMGVTSTGTTTTTTTYHVVANDTTHSLLTLLHRGSDGSRGLVVALRGMCVEVVLRLC